MLREAPQQTSILLRSMDLISREWAQWFRDLRDAVNGTRSGMGSPESVVTAPIGTLYRRLDGGAGTTLYVKESGTGNTGWSAK